MQAVDLIDAGTYQRGIPHEYFAWLRDHEPVHWQEGRPGRGNVVGFPELDQRGHWAITRYDDVLTVSLDQKRFSSERGTSLVMDLPEDRIERLRHWMINQDLPRHTRLRRLINQGFTRRRIEQLTPHIRDLAREIVQRVAPLGECDFVAEIASELPLVVIAELVGSPAEDRAKLFAWSNRLVGFDDPEVVGDTATNDTMAEMFEYAATLARQRRDEPRDDLTSALVHAEVDGEKLDEVGFSMFFILLILAGNETTRNAISGGMHALSEHPAEMEKLRADRSLLPTATEEILRYVSPVITMRRTATCDTSIGGQAVRENDKVVMYYPSANRDEKTFDAPDRFDVARDPNLHVAFGWGPHFCLGAALARAEIRCIFDELLQRLPDIEVSGPATRLRSTTVNSIKTLPVRFTPQSGA